MAISRDISKKDVITTMADIDEWRYYTTKYEIRSSPGGRGMKKKLIRNDGQEEDEVEVVVRCHHRSRQSLYNDLRHRAEICRISWGRGSVVSDRVGLPDIP